MATHRYRAMGGCAMLALLLGLSSAATIPGVTGPRVRRSVPTPFMDMEVTVARPIQLTGDEKAGTPLEVEHTRSKRSTSQFSASDIEGILAHNNQLRAQEGASDMQTMRWNSDLADMAQEWAEQCHWGHGQPSRTNPPFSYIGQNLFFTTSSNLNETRGTQLWYNEKSDYTYGTGCQAERECGHYTQVVWADTHSIGCGHHYCDNIIGNYDGSYLVCNYGPAGNWIGQLPYTLGTPCSECANDQFCVNGLCSDESAPEPNDDTTDTCACEVNPAGDVMTFDGEALALPTEGKVTLSIWEDVNTDPCKYELNAQTNANGLSWFAFNVGVHKNPSKMYRSLTFGRKTTNGFEARGQQGPGAVALPYTFESPDQQTIVTVDGNEDDGFTITSSTCPYELTWEPKAASPKLTLTLTDNKYTSGGAGPQGLCKEGAQCY